MRRCKFSVGDRTIQFMELQSNWVPTWSGTSKIFSQVHKKLCALFIYTCHFRDLVSSFNTIILIDTYGINPDHSEPFRRAKEAEHRPTVTRLQQDIPVGSDENGLAQRAVAILTTPGIGHCFVFWAIIMAIRLQIRMYGIVHILYG